MEIRRLHAPASWHSDIQPHMPNVCMSLEGHLIRYERLNVNIRKILWYHQESNPVHLWRNHDTTIMQSLLTPRLRNYSPLWAFVAFSTVLETFPENGNYGNQNLRNSEFTPVLILVRLHWLCLRFHDVMVNVWNAFSIICLYMKHTKWHIFVNYSVINIIYIIFLWFCSPARAMASSFHTQRHPTVGRTLLDEWSSHRRDLYLTIHNKHNRRTSMPRWDSNPRS
jgi:hypothetical protein